MLERMIGILAAVLCFSCVGANAEKVDCPEPPKQMARDVSVDTQAKLAALGRLGAAELKNKTQVIVRPLLDKVPNADRVHTADSLISVFCQLLSSHQIEDREKVDRFQVFSTQVMGFVNGSVPQQRSVPVRSAPPPADTSKQAKQRQPAVKLATPLQPIRLGATVKEVGEYLSHRQTDWQRGKTYKVSFARDLGGLSLTDEIVFDDNDRAINHTLGTKAVRIDGRKPKTLGPDPREYCESATAKLLLLLVAKLGAPVQPLVTDSKPVDVDWRLLDYKDAPCEPMSYSICRAEARATKSSAMFELEGSHLTLTAMLVAIEHRRAKDLGDNVYTKSSQTCTVSIEDPGFVYFQLLEQGK